MSTPHTRQAARPSPMKINALRSACARLGYSGLDDPRFVAFVRSVAGVDRPRFMTGPQASVVLVEMILPSWRSFTSPIPTPGAHEGE